MRDLDAMCGRMRAVLESEGSGYPVASEEARRLCRMLPLVHRTVGPGASLSDILSGGHIEARPPCTPREIACGISKAAYFFLGCAAYPEGAMAFVAPNRLLQGNTASFTPFDSGSLEKHLRPRSVATPWEPTDKDAFLAEHLGMGNHAVEFCIDYVAALFADATGYVTGPQVSIPDAMPYHGLICQNGDRRAWSIEIQMHEDLDLSHLDAIVLAQQDLYDDLPDALSAKAIFADDDGSICSRVQQLILEAAS